MSKELQSTNNLKINTGIDLGSMTLRATIIISANGEKHIIHSEVESDGIRNGSPVDERALANSLIKLKNKVKIDYGVSILHAAVGVSGNTICSGYTFGAHMISRGDGVVSDDDIDQAILKAESAYGRHNMHILESIPVKYRLDNKPTTPPVIGLHGNKLEIKLMSVACDSQIYNKIITAMKIAKIEVSEVVSSSLTEAQILLSKKDKSQGSILVNIGASSTSIMIYNAWEPVYAGYIAYGTENIVKAIAISLKLKLEDAEYILKGVSRESFSKKKLDDTLIIEATKLSTLINTELDKLKLREMLPSGVILLSKTHNIATFNTVLRDKLSLPMRHIESNHIRFENIKISDCAYIRSYSIADRDYDITEDEASFGALAKAFNHIKVMISQFLP